MPELNAKVYKIVLKGVSLILFFCLFGSVCFASNSKPLVGSISPASGSSIPNKTLTFTTTYSDANGSQDIKDAYFLINASVTGSNCFSSSAIKNHPG